MPLPAYMNIPDIPGSCKVEGRTNWIEVLGFEHEVHIPVDRKDSTTTGTRVHASMTIVKNFDKASPKLYQYLCNGKIIPTATLTWYKIDEQGVEKPYFEHNLTNARVTKVHSHMPDVDNPANEQYKHM